MVLEMLEARFGILGIHSNVLVWEEDTPVPFVGKEVDQDCAKCAIKIGTNFCGGVEYLVGCLAAIKQVFPFVFFNKVVLWCE